MTTLDIKVESLGRLVQKPVFEYPDDRPQCEGTVQPTSYSNPKGICKSKATTRVNEHCYCDRHAGFVLLDLHLGRSRVTSNGR